MEYQSESLLNGSKQKLFIHRWSLQRAVARVLIVHGYAEHGYRYREFARFLNESDIDVISYDQRGHGKSEGLKAYIPRFDVLLDDLQVIIDHISSDIPTILLGHSLGGLIAVKYCVERDPGSFMGLITSAAALKLDEDLSPILQRIAPFLSWLFPTLPTTLLDITYLTRSEENRVSYTTDPLNYRKGTRARTGAEMIKAIKETSAKFSQLNIPFLSLHGSADKLTDPRGTQQLFESAQSAYKRIKIYKGLYHELIHEPEKQVVMKDIRDWIIKLLSIGNNQETIQPHG